MTKCRLCSSENLRVVLDFNKSPPSNSYIYSNSLNKTENYYPLRINLCKSCYLMQTEDFVNKNEMFNAEYSYFSSYSKTFINHSKKYLKYINSNLKKYFINNEVIEIASNDGYLLQFFKKDNYSCLGIEPSKSVADFAKKKGINTKVEFFGSKLAKKLKGKNKPSLIIANNVLAHVPDLNDFIKGLSILSRKETIISIEFPHILNLIKFHQFDTIYHEHYSYFSIKPLVKIFLNYGLEIFNIQNLNVHGGSLRLFLKKRINKKIKIDKSVSHNIKLENKYNIYNLKTYSDLQNKLNSQKINILRFIINLKLKKKKIICYGAAAKGNTIINFSGITKDIIDFVVDKNKNKIGKYLPGSEIPIVDIKNIKKIKPDYIWILPWNLKEEIIKELSFVRKWNTKFFITNPKIKLIS